jgi:hypothetical protein
MEPTTQSFKGQIGGYRPNAGRKMGSKNPNTKMRLDLQTRWLERINKIADAIFDAHETLALGHWFEDEINGTRIRIYKKSPDRAALEWILDQTFGKAPLKLEVEGEITTGSYQVTPETQAVLEQAILYALPDENQADDDGTANPQGEEVQPTENADTPPAP